MKPLLSIFGMIWRDQRWALVRSVGLSVVVLAMGVALLGVSGWFIIAAGAAGIAGTGAVFDVFRPSAAVRFLALGRTAARYGERLLTHDATLRALTEIRLRLLQRVSSAPFPVMIRFRGADVLNRVTADVDVLDGVALRLVIPVLAGCTALAGAWAVLTWLVDPVLAAWSVVSLCFGSAAALIYAARRSLRASRMAEASNRAFRIRLVDHLRGRAMLAFAGQLETSEKNILRADARSRSENQKLARVERRAGALISVTATLGASGALLIGAEMARQGYISPAQAALGFFATLALAETVTPLRRGVAEIGGMRDAARRVTRILADEPKAVPVQIGKLDEARGLEFETVSVSAIGARMPLVSGLSLRVPYGETVALTGRSGAGKSTFMNAAAGLIPVSDGEIRLAGCPLPQWPERDLRCYVGYLPQRSVLTSGSIGENLRLASPEAKNADLVNVLESVALSGAIEKMGGLDARLGESGKGLSGGEARRLELARVLLRRPRVLLLDEPTEGLDRHTAELVLAGIRRLAPHSAILLSAHRAVERDWADQCVGLD